MSRFIREKFLTAMQQDQFVRSRFPHFRRTTNRGDQIKWRGTLQPSPRSDLYEVEIAYEIPCRPHIQVMTPGLTTWGDLKGSRIPFGTAACVCTKRTNGTETNLSRRRSFRGRACGWRFTKRGWKPGAGSAKELIRICRNTVRLARSSGQQHEIVASTAERKTQNRCIVEPRGSGPAHSGSDAAAALRSCRWSMRIRWLPTVSDGTSGDFDRGQFRASGPRCCVPKRWTEGARSVASEGYSRSPESHASLSSMSQADRRSTQRLYETCAFGIQAPSRKVDQASNRSFAGPEDGFDCFHRSDRQANGFHFVRPHA